MWRRALQVCFAVGTLLGSTHARAESRRLSDEEIHQLETLSSRGQQACEAKDYATCYALFEKAQSILPWPPHQYYMGEALVGRGQMRAGVELWHHMLEASTATSDSVVDEAMQLAKQRLSEVEPTIPTLQFQLRSGQRSHVQVRLDGETLSPTELRAPVKVDPGTHRFDLEGQGFASEHHEVVLSAGIHQQILVALQPLDPVPATPSAPPPSSTWRAPAGWALVGSGAAAMVASLVVYLHKEGLNRSLEEECETSKCPGLSAAEFDKRRQPILRETYLTNGLLFGGAGLAALGSGLLVWEAYGDWGEETAVRASTGPGELTLSVSGRF
jgi:hypothetical protein